MTELLPVVPAATIILLRERAAAPPEILMVERASTLAFVGSATVFPGGKVDPDDHAIARDAARTAGIADIDDTAARIAAIRECLEETGLAIGFSAPPAQIAAMRAALHGGTAFSSLLARHDLQLDLEALVPFARWCPAFKGKRRFDTRFYLAAAPSGQAVADGTESVRIRWDCAQATLDAADAGERHIVFPTKRNLERLAQAACAAEIFADATAFPVRTIVSFIETRDGVEHLCIPDGHGYPVLSEPVATARRT